MSAFDPLARIAERRAAPKQFVCVTRYASGRERRIETETRGQAENHAAVMSRKIGRDLICHETGETVRVVAVDVRPL